MIANTEYFDEEHLKTGTESESIEYRSDSYSYKAQKYKALYQARRVLSKIGSMEERRVCSKRLKMMLKKGE